MLFVNYKINASKESVVSSLAQNEEIVLSEKLNSEKCGYPRIHTTINEENIKMLCEMTDKPTRDRDFRRGTFFMGKIKETSNGTSISGVILTAPVYHFVLICLFAYFIYKCISLGGFSVVPVFILLFDVLMFL